MKSILFLICLFSTQVYAADGLHDESELGVAIVSGNTNTETYNAKQITTYNWDTHVLKASGHYLNSRANGVDSARNWDAGIRYEKVITDTVNVFASHSIESNTFASIIQQNNYDLGAKYFFTQSEETKWFAELGYRYIFTRYTGNGNDVTSHNARIFSEFSQTLSKTATFKLGAEYIKSFTNGEDYQLNAEPSLTVLLNSIFSLKTSYGIKYHNLVFAPALYRLDTLFSTALVAKF